MTPNWASDRRLDILVLGPMSEHEKNPAASTGPVRDALQALLKEPEFETLLASRGVRDAFVEIPDANVNADIFHGVMSRLDTADLVVINLTPKSRAKLASANVLYELALVHALGIPALLVAQSSKDVPFYAKRLKVYRAATFDLPTLCAKLRPPLLEFLQSANAGGEFTQDPVSLFYGGLPIVDISAAVGLATGYYHNFVGRLLFERGFLAAHPKLIRQVIIVRPSGVSATWQSDQLALTEALSKEGLVLKRELLSEPPGDPLGSLWIDHIDGIVVDLPRTIYPLQRSPRLLQLRGRGVGKRSTEQRLYQVGQHLLDRVKTVIDHHVRLDANGVRSHILHHCSIQEAPALVRSLLQQN